MNDGSAAQGRVCNCRFGAWERNTSFDGSEVRIFLWALLRVLLVLRSDTLMLVCATDEVGLLMLDGQAERRSSHLSLHQGSRPSDMSRSPALLQCRDVGVSVTVGSCFVRCLFYHRGGGEAPSVGIIPFPTVVLACFLSATSSDDWVASSFCRA